MAPMGMRRAGQSTTRMLSDRQRCLTNDSYICTSLTLYASTALTMIV
jgi:hypothetical protein